MEERITGRRKPTKPKKQARVQKRKRDDVDVEKLQKAVDDLDPKDVVTKFTDLPLSEPTMAGLRAAHFSNLTDIQAKAIAVGLKGSDILGAARTGSGKTLAFLLPVLENLYRSQCVGTDAGLGAMIIAPTRELAIQIFDVLYKIGKHGHLFAAGLVIGGKGLHEEQHALARMNIVVCTPGRMLQHLSQTADFSVDNLQMLVLDEADRILDMGFQRDVDAIIDYLPADRQTLLFSATQTKRVSDLARLSLKDPAYISVHESAASATPKGLQQNYVLTPLPTKLDTLWSFIQSSKKSKLLVFLSSGKQVRFVYEAFRKMQPGIPLLHLHGRQRQTARLDITTKFAASKQSCLFATDVAARGLDFPAVDWVVQVDCPEDADTYIHRVGRTARYERDGRGVLFLDPSEEEGMLERLASKKVPIERINIRAKKQTSIKNQLQGMCFKDPELKYLGQKAFVSYVRSIHVQKDKGVFHIQQYDLENYAASLGLPGAPRIKFMKGDAEAQKKLKNQSRQAEETDDSEVEGDGADKDGAKRGEVAKPRTKYDRMFERRNQDVLSSHYSRLKADGGFSPAAGDSDDAVTFTNAGSDAVNELNGKDIVSADRKDADEDLFTVKRRIPAPASSSANPIDDQKGNDSMGHKSSGLPTSLKIDSQRKQNQLKSRAKAAKLLHSLKDPALQAKHFTFDDSGGMHDVSKPEFEDENAVGKDAEEREERRREWVGVEGEKMRERDMKDKDVEKARRRELKERRKRRERGEDGRGKAVEDIEEKQEEEEEEDGLPVMASPFQDLADLYQDEPPRNLDPLRGQVDPNTSPKPPPPSTKATPPPKANNPTPEPSTLRDLERIAATLLD